ncbi:MAG: hypothetical protein AB2807_09025 [Candidatus Sedimenticola endophacoides]
MDIIVRHLPDTITHYELERFVRRGIGSHWSLLGRVPDGELLRCPIMKITDQAQGYVEFHGLATIEPPGVAQGTTVRLDGASWQGQVMSVSKFMRRLRLRDKRQNRTLYIVAHHGERRRGESTVNHGKSTLRPNFHYVASR